MGALETAMADSSPQLEDGNNEESVQDFLRILEEHRAECEAQGKYVEAEIAKKRLDELQEHEANRQKEAMRSRQITERLGVEEAHMMEFQQFNAIWDKKMEEFKANAKQLVDNMKKKHSNELFRFKERLQKSQPYRPKFSKELLNTRKIQETLAKMKQYAEAHKVELKKLRSQHAHKLAAQEMQFAQRQTAELAALEKRIETARQEHKIQRQQDLERLLQRYQNVKSELEAQQKIERIRSEKYKGHSAMYSTISAAASQPPSR